MFFIILIVVIIVTPTITATMNKTKRGKTTTTTTTTIEITSSTTNNNTRWKQNAVTVAGGNGLGIESNQLYNPRGIYINNDDQSIYIADTSNHRIVRWEFGADNGEIVAGGNGKGYGIHQLNDPSDVVLDKEKKYIIICDQTNARVTRWSRQNSQDPQILIHRIYCWGLAIDNNGDLYVSDLLKHEVRRFQQGDKEGTVVAGGHGLGSSFDQLWQPSHIFVDEYYSIYVADHMNNRVMKWMKNATKGILVVPEQVSGKNSNPLIFPIGLIVDHMSNIYVSTNGIHQIIRWSPAATEGIPVVGEKEFGVKPTQLLFPQDLSFDGQGNLYVVDRSNDRIQRFDIDLD
ncbi:unnamed protein product [Adineta steineri]|uniref:Uncharacterized protein n=1 Tax=Adineta steineri TaxID=433720 RepID=A0A816BIL1_9BILA|nr:unnamed protein product [Adineta steineri]CAF1610672.1 unnamed protein product [Adineta steineri]